MSPAELKVLLHYYAVPEPLPPSVGGDDTTKKFLSDGVIERYEGNGEYRTTKKGDVWVNTILATPMPIQVWLDTRTKS